PPTAAALALLLGLGAARADAQQQRPGLRVACAGQPVTEIQVMTRPPYFVPNGKWWQTPLSILNSIHVNTQPDVVRRFLLLQPGMPCDEQRRLESERILRAQPFIADATIQTYSDGNGGAVLVVQTRDELTPIVGMTTSSRSPYVTALKVGEGNLMGSARYVTAQWGKGELRDTYGAHVIDYQFLGRPWHLDALAIREEAGVSGWSLDLSHPFFTDQQRIAWRVALENRRDVFAFMRGDLEPAAIGIDRSFFDIGGVVRIGAPGQLSLFGLSFSHEDDLSGLPPLPDSLVDYPSLLEHFRHRKNFRINYLWGVRSIGYKRASHFDALSATQDLRVGFQLGTLLGRTLRVLGSHDDDILLAGDVYIGAGNSHTFAMLQGEIEGRDDFDSTAWDGIIGSAHLAVYRRLTASHTLVSMLDWGGGWRQRIPLQLALGQVDAGVRGYIDSHDAGAQRGVVRLEDRWYLGKVFRDQADLGLALFTDAGRTWAGDAPYGVSTPVKVGLGFGVLAAIPPGSKRTWRMDVAFPVSPDARAKWEIRFSTTNANRPYDREPRDIRYSRERVVPSSVFSWP
ncbi:MAG: hypothetical protein IRY91_14135, partial [Gemmatimonadaceae bacterium]|nr:hypothetical protein [Gemmatimonadaceae bacterium]